jgi:ATP adenylyltransferase
MTQKQLWAPWRMEYLSDNKDKRDIRCVFCKLPAESADRENLIVHRGEKAFVILNKYPYNNGHVMIVPGRHLSDYAELADDELLDMGNLTRHTVNALKSAYQCEGFNIGMNLGTAGGAGIKDHLHLHVVPRWIGDTNFMPVLADTKSMPQHLLSSYDSIHEYFRRLRPT